MYCANVRETYQKPGIEVDFPYFASRTIQGSMQDSGGGVKG
jgi:hypothetical protein